MRREGINVIANLELMRPGAADAGSRGEIGVNHVAWSFASAHDLLSTYKRLKAAGIMPYWPVHHGPTLSLYYADPDGNRMEFQADALTVANGVRTPPAGSVEAEFVAPLLAGAGLLATRLVERWSARGVADVTRATR